MAAPFSPTSARTSCGQREKSTPESTVLPWKDFEIPFISRGAAALRLYRRYLSMGGFTSSWIEGSLMLAAVTTAAPVSIRFGGVVP
jgi:hypothetical protein